MEFVFALIDKIIKNTGLKSYKKLKRLANKQWWVEGFWKNIVPTTKNINKGINNS